MEKKVIEEIIRVREIMGLKLITEGTFGPPKFLDELFQELAEKARTGDSALAGRFDDFLEGLKKTGKNVGNLNDYAFGAKNGGRDITNDLGDQLDDVYKFVDELVTDSGNGTIWKTYLTDALKNSSDNLFKSIGDKLVTAKNTLKNMKGYDDEAHDKAVDALTNIKNFINNSNLDDKLKPILLARYGLDNIPTKKITSETTDNIVDQADEMAEEAVESIPDSPEIRRQAGDYIDPNNWIDVPNLSQSEIDFIAGKAKLSTKVGNWFKSWFESSKSKLDRLAQITKTLRKRGDIKSQKKILTPEEKIALEDEMKKILDELWLENRKLFKKVDTWFKQISADDYDLRTIVNNLKGETKFANQAMGLAYGNNSWKMWWESIKQGYKNAFTTPDIPLISDWYKSKLESLKLIKSSAENTSKDIIKENASWKKWLGSGSVIGRPSKGNINYKEIIEKGGLPQAKKTYMMELLFRTAKWKVVWATLTTITNFISFQVKGESASECKLKMDKIKSGIDSDPELSKIFKNSKGEYLWPQQPIIKAPLINADGSFTEQTTPYTIADGTIIVVPEVCYTGGFSEMWAQDYAEGKPGFSRFREEFVENIINSFTDFSWDEVSDLFPGKYDDLAASIYEYIDWGGREESYDDFVKRLDLQIYKAEQKINEGSKSLENAKNNNEQTEKQRELSLDSLNIVKPEIKKADTTKTETPTPPTPPTPTETTTPAVPGTASEEDKKSLKQQMNDDNYFDTEIISVDSIGGGRIKVTYKSKNPSGTNKYNELEKNSEGNWIYTYGKLKGQVY